MAKRAVVIGGLRGRGGCGRTTAGRVGEERRRWLAARCGDQGAEAEQDGLKVTAGEAASDGEVRWRAGACRAGEA